MSTALVWFRRDLRLEDQPALAAALAAGHRVVPVYVHAPEEDGDWTPGAASRWWLHHSLQALSGELERRGSRLIVRRGPTLPTLLDLARESGATAVHWNRLYEPASIARDSVVKAGLRSAGLAADSHNGHLLFEPWQVETGSGGPYKVFTPFWRNCAARLDALPLPQAAPARLAAVPATIASTPIESLGLLPRIRWDDGLRSHWSPGAAGALRQLGTFVDETIAGYAKSRDVPASPGTSRLSPHLHFGELSPRQALAAARSASLATRSGTQQGADSFIRELGWREFAHHLLYHFPATTDLPLDRRFERLDWQPPGEPLRAWQQGRTGLPIVDAGMRELWHTGWMHNRVRMIVASLLTKNLFLHWRHGARWFWDTLVDADLASNTLGWQWTAGCGADAAPYYRIFNPVLQGERFDPGGDYVRRWIPELAHLPASDIHAPWAAKPAVLAAAGVTLGDSYPRPIVDLKESRDAALARFAALKA